MRGARIIRERVTMKCRNESNEVIKNLRQTIIKLRGAVVCRNNPRRSREVHIGGCESRVITAMDSNMAGPILVKLSGIDEGNSVHVLQQKMFGSLL